MSLARVKDSTQRKMPVAKSKQAVSPDVSKSMLKLLGIHSVTIICVFLTVALCTVYLQVKDHQFINFDDNDYVTKNSYVLSGLNSESLKWAFSYSKEENTYWHPLTWISHMTDIQLWGLDAGKHHLTNLFLHIVNTLLLFIVLRSMTGALWKSAFVASLFAFHPINVDTVAWVAERKNLLSTCFLFLTMLAYSSYVKRPSFVRYLIVTINYIMGLFAKPMLVTLPFVLLLLDYWPLGRFSFLQKSRGGPDQSSNPLMQSLTGLLKSRIILEKIPLILLALLSVYISSLSLKTIGSITSFNQVPVGLRIENALVSYIAYILKAIWPYNLAVYYPFPQAVPFWQVVAAFILLVLITAVVVAASRRHPYLCVGWLWYAGTLVPVCGIYQAGLWPAMADRWAYIPFIGIFIMVTWGISELLDKWRFGRTAIATSAGFVLMILMVSSWVQTKYWENSITLFKHAIDVTGDNNVAQNNLATALMHQGDLDGAMKHCAEALRISPDYAYALNNMGLILKKKGDIPQAVSNYNRAIQINPTYVDAYNNLGVAMIDQGRNGEALQQFSKIIEITSGYLLAYIHMGVCLTNLGRANEAIQAYQKAIQIKSDSLEAHYNLAITLLSQGKKDEAIEHFNLVLNIDPGNIQTQKILSLLLLNRNK